MPVIKREIDIAIEALFQSLPASNYEEIRRAMAKELGRRINTGYVAQTLHHLRKNVAEYGFTVPYVQRGSSNPTDDKDRYFAMLVKPDGSFYVDPDHRRHFTNGSISTALTIGTLSKNLVVMIDTYCKYERSKPRREFWEDMSETLTFIAKRAARITNQIKAQQQNAA